MSDADASTAEQEEEAAFAKRRELGMQVMRKWGERTDEHDGCFIHYIDGDRSNADASNVEYVQPYSLFCAILEHGHDFSVRVDWADGLSDEEAAFVRQNVKSFMETYKPQVPGMDDPHVVSLTAQGDAAMEAGEYERAVELYDQAKRVRAELTAKPSPQHGRRAIPKHKPMVLTQEDRTAPVVCTAEPNRRKLPVGAKTPKQLAEERIAARK